MTITLKVKHRDPEAAWVRNAIAARRVGVNAKCACGETRPQALIPKSNPTMCHRCKRTKQGKTTIDNHHVFAKTNSPITLPMPVNDHRAELSVAQYDWPKNTRENSDGSPFLAAAGTIRGFIDTILYLVKQGLLWIADMLEAADRYLLNKLGPKWWLNTELDQYAPKQQISRREPK